MKISTKGQYAVRAMLDLTEQSHNYPVPLSNISVRQEISLHYLEQLFVRLRRARLVNSIRGPGGGYVLAKSPSDITIGDILRAVSEDISISECTDLSKKKKELCKKVGDCVASVVWQKLAKHISDILDSITLEDLRKEDKKKDQEKALRHSFAFSI
ncbi:MAG: Rrf2 family transcriptional regulator [Nitrospinae bacterium]|nr:Rrf2 family transcriptional regulator [Nitrospinota bacterium]